MSSEDFDIIPSFLRNTSILSYFYFFTDKDTFLPVCDLKGARKNLSSCCIPVRHLQAGSNPLICFPLFAGFTLPAVKPLSLDMGM
jgi:hypothetical protein